MSLVDAIPIGIREVGRARAQGAQAGGAYGVALADIGKMVGDIPAEISQRKSRDMQAQIQQGQLAVQQTQVARAKREEAADAAMQGAFSAALAPDGTLDRTKLSESIVGTPAAADWLKIQDALDRADEALAARQLTKQRVATGEDDVIGAGAHVASQTSDPTEQAALFTSYLTGKAQQGAISQDRAKREIADLLDDTGAPDPSKVSARLKSAVEGSGVQRTLAETEAQKAALAAKAQADAAEKAAKLQQQRFENVGSMLSSAGDNQALYARIYAGIPNEFKSQFDAPDVWTPESSKRAGLVILSPAERVRMQHDEAMLKHQETPKTGTFEDYVLRTYGKEPTPTQILQARKDYGQADDRPRVSVAVSGNAADDVKLAVQAMKEGTVPPMLPGRASKEYLATMAEAKRQGYDLAKAATDWTATQKHIATMNGAQQLRLNQSINQLPDLLDSVDNLASQWKGGRFPILNKANLAAAKNGLYGQDVASVANRLDAQIADVVSDLGNVYMGGNSPTDHALSLAQKSLSADWSEKVLHDMVKMAKDNVIIRRNSIANTGVAGVGADNPYAPQSQQTAPVIPAKPASIPGVPSYADYLKSKGGK